MTLYDRFVHFEVSLVALLLFVFICLPGKAQSVFGNIVGTVSDPTGGVIPGSSVTLTNLETNEKRKATTDSSGDYRFLDLTAANYRLDVAKNGFENLTIQPINVEAGAELRMNAALKIGTATETVVVEASAPLLQTESGTVSNVVEGKTVQEMPLNGRNTMNLIALTPGVVPGANTSGAPAMNAGQHTDNYAWANYQIGGDAAGEDVTYIDGGPMMGLGQNNLALIPTQDSIQEFRVAVSAVSPEFGRFAGGVVQMTSKSGTNVFHGTLYEYVRNTILNANPFFSNLNGTPRNPLHQNQYGATVGGPIKQNKAFFLFSWENFALRMGVPTTTNVPTANMNAGKFYGKTLNASAAPSGCITNGLSDAGGTYAQVSPSCFDPSAVVMSGYFPSPNATGSNNYFVNLPIPDNTSQYVGRVDYNLSQKQSLFLRYTYWNLKDSPPHVISSKYGFGVNYAKNNTQALAFGDTYTFNPTTVLDVRLSGFRQIFAHIPIALTQGGIDQSTFGPAYAAMAPFESAHLLPNLAFSGSDNLYNVTGTNSNAYDTYDLISLTSNLTKVFGHHTLKAGGEVRYADRSGFGTNLYPSGGASFKSSTVGDEYAAFLLGDYVTDQIVTDSITAGYNYYQGYYVGDTWQASQRLTLSLGLRWELPGGIAEKNNRATVLLPNTVDPATGDLGAVALTASNLYPSRSVIPVRLDLFSPRIGFAQRLGNDTVVRGGYGLNYLPNDLPYGTMPYNSPVNFATTQTFGAYHSLSDPFKVLSGGSFLQPVGRSNPNFSKSLLGQVVVSPVPQGMAYPTIQQYNLTLSRQWKGNWLTEISYIGAKGTHLPGEGSNNASIYTYSGLDELSSQYYSTLQTMEAAGSTQAQLIAYGQARRPYPQFQDYVNDAEYKSGSTYNAMYLNAEKRFHKGGVLHANYAWSKQLGDADNVIREGGGYVQDFNNPKGEYSLLGFDVRNRLVVSYVLDLPFGKGQKYANFNGVAGVLVSGWSANGLTAFQSGTPLKFSYSNGNYLSTYLGAGTIRPNVVAGCNKQTSGSPYEKWKNKDWFNSACFAYAGDFAFGNEPRVDATLRSQGIDNFDFAVQKATTIKDETNLEFRAEFFNLFNHPQFSAPGTGLGGGGYDQITSQANNPRLVQLSLRLRF